MRRDAIPSTAKAGLLSMIFINGSSENCRIQRALLWNRCFAGSLFLLPCFRSAIARRLLDALAFAVQGLLSVSVRRRFPKIQPPCPEGSFEDGSFARALEISESRHPEIKDGWQVSTYSTPGSLQNPRLGFRRFHSFNDSSASGAMEIIATLLLNSA